MNVQYTYSHTLKFEEPKSFLLKLTIPPLYVFCYTFSTHADLYILMEHATFTAILSTVHLAIVCSVYVIVHSLNMDAQSKFWLYVTIDAYDRCKNPLAAAAAATARQHGIVTITIVEQVYFFMYSTYMCINLYTPTYVHTYVYLCVAGIHSNFGTLSIASGQLHYSQTPKPSDKLASNNLGMKTPESKTNWLSDDASGTSKRFSNDEKTESENTTKTVPQQVSDSDEATAGSSTYTNKLAAASASTVSSITSTEESVTLEAYNKEVTGVTITTDEMTNNNLPATTTEGGGAPFSSPVPTTKPQDSGKFHIWLLCVWACGKTYIARILQWCLFTEKSWQCRS